jgi:hypothetical protein
MDLLVEASAHIPVSQEELQKELRRAIATFAKDEQPKQLGVETAKLEP